MHLKAQFCWYQRGSKLLWEVGILVYFTAWPCSPVSSIKEECFFRQLADALSVAEQRAFKRNSFLSCKHNNGTAPLLDRHYPTSSLLWAAPTSYSADSLVIDSQISFQSLDLRESDAGRISQLPWSFFRCALSSITPTVLTCAFVYFFHASCRLRHLWQVSQRYFSVTRPKQVHFIRARIFVVGRSHPSSHQITIPQCFACFVTFTRQCATNWWINNYQFQYFSIE